MRSRTAALLPGFHGGHHPIRPAKRDWLVMMRAVTDWPVPAAPAFQVLQHRWRDIDRGDMDVRGQEVEVQTRSGADDQHAVARIEPQSVNRQSASGVESCCTGDGVVRRRSDRVPQSVPHDHALPSFAVSRVEGRVAVAAPARHGSWCGYRRGDRWPDRCDRWRHHFGSRTKGQVRAWHVTSYSVRNAIVGSMLSARRVGTTQPSMQTPRMTNP